jgi:hypothetical protein
MRVPVHLVVPAKFSLAHIYAAIGKPKVTSERGGEKGSGYLTNHIERLPKDNGGSGVLRDGGGSSQPKSGRGDACGLNLANDILDDQPRTPS